MRICMLVRNPFVSDARVRREARALSGAGHDVTIVALAAEGLPERDRIDGLEVVRIPVLPRSIRRAARALRREGEVRAAAGGALAARRRWVRNVVFDRVASRAFERAARAVRADAYHAHDLNMLPAAIRAARAHRARVVYDAHELYPEMNGLAPAERVIWRAIESRSIRRADEVITVNGSVADELALRYGIPRPTVVMNVPEPSPGGDVEVPDALRAGGTIILSLGGVTTGRGLEQSVDALRSCEGTLVLLGPVREPFAEALRERARAVGVEDRVVFAGSVPPEHVVAAASTASVGLCTIRNVSRSYYLSLPNKLFEYLHAGVPVVASDFPEIARIVRTYDAGELCDPEDPASIARAITRVVSDPSRHAQLRANARRAAGDVTWQAQADSLLELYARLGPSTLP